MKRVVVLGANGQIGKFLLERFSLESDFVACGTSRSTRPRCITFDPFHDDWTQLGKTDVLINCVGIIREREKDTFERIHVELTKKIIANRLRIGNPRIIQLSALGARINHPVRFLRTKAEADEYLLQFEKTVVVRPSIICTPQTMLVRKLLIVKKMSKVTGGRLFLPEGLTESCIQPVMPDDVADLIMALIHQNDATGIINAPGPERIAFGTLLNLLLPSGKIHRLPKPAGDFLINHIVSVLFPRTINRQQYQLLLEDNVADAVVIERYLNRPLTSTLKFWINQLTPLCQPSAL